MPLIFAFCSSGIWVTIFAATLSGAETIAERARTYLDVNCAHCHQAGGTASNTSLRLDALGPADWSLGLCKPSVAAGKGTGDRIHDIVPGKPDAIVFPKAEGGSSVVHLDAKLTAREAMAGLPEGQIKILAQAVESAAGLFLAGTFRDASARLIGMTWGPEDLSSELGAEANREADGMLTEPYRLARSICLFGAAAAKVPAIETIHVNFRDPEVLRRDTELARRDGFSGRLAIHPAQVAVINEVFTPSPEHIAKAKAVVAAFAAQPGAGAVGIDGKMYDRPHLLRAQALLARIG